MLQFLNNILDHGKKQLGIPEFINGSVVLFHKTIFINPSYVLRNADTLLLLISFCHILVEVIGILYLLDLHWNAEILTNLPCNLPDPWICIHSNSIYVSIKDSVISASKIWTKEKYSAIYPKKMRS